MNGANRGSGSHLWAAIRWGLLCLGLIGIVPAAHGLTFTVMNTDDAGAGSLRDAIEKSNQTAGAARNEIKFNIGGEGPHTIKLHVSAILHQLKLKSRTQAALLASKIYKQGSVDPLRSGAETSKKASTAPAQRN